jgi:hypothetical protein
VPLPQLLTEFHPRIAEFLMCQHSPCGATQTASGDLIPRLDWKCIECRFRGGTRAADSTLRSGACGKRRARREAAAFSLYDSQVDDGDLPAIRSSIEISSPSSPYNRLGEPQIDNPPRLLELFLQHNRAVHADTSADFLDEPNLRSLAKTIGSSLSVDGRLRLDRAAGCNSGWKL